MPRPINLPNPFDRSLKDPSTPFMTASDYESMLLDSELPSIDSTATLLNYWISTNQSKLDIVNPLSSYLQNLNATNVSVVSFGTGLPLVEFLLASALGDSFRFLASDFVELYICKARQFLTHPSIQYHQININDLPNSQALDNFLSGRVHNEPTVALFVGSLYALNDEQILLLLSRLHGMGFTNVLDLHAGFLPSRVEAQYYRNLYEHLRASLLNPSLSSDAMLTPRTYHGYNRFRHELESLYSSQPFFSRIDFLADTVPHYPLVIHLSDPQQHL